MTKNKLLAQGKGLLAAAALALGANTYAQNPSLHVFEDWRTEAGTQNTFYRAGAIIVPGTVNSIVYGATLNANGDYDMLVQQLDNAGSAVWSYQFDGPGGGDDVATSVCYDPTTGYTYVAGSYFEDSSDSLNAIVIALQSNGTLDWSATYNGTGSGADGFADVDVDQSTGEIYCTGTEWAGLGTMYDILIAKYDATGSQLWVTTQDFMSMIDGGFKLVISSKPFLMAAGQNGPASFRYGIVDFDATGAIGGMSFSGGTAMGYDRAADITLDDTGNVYLIGSVYNITTWSDIRVTKYDTLLNVVWEHDIDAGYNMDDYGAGIALDSHNNVIIVGTSKTVNNGMNYTVIKYDNAGGLIFYDSFDGAALGNDSAAAVVVSPNDTDAVYVTGYSFNGSTNDYHTIRYSGTGSRLWEIDMNSVLNGDDIATAIALDTLGNVVVSGQTNLADTVYAYTTVKYMQKNVLMPEDTTPYVSNSFIYTENRGQVWGTDSATHPEIKYYVINSMPKIYFMDTAVSYVFTKLDTATVTTPTDTLARVDMKFENANSNLRIRSMNKREDYENFFLGHIPEGRSNVPNYNQLASFNVWNNVDVIYGSNLAGMKYYFVCKPGGGGNPAAQIDLLYNGADSVAVDGSGQLIIYTPLGNIVQPKAAAWQLDATGNYQSLGWQPSYSIIGTNEVAFSGFGSFNTGQPLIIAIDWGNITPTTNQDNLWWSTFYGGGTDDNFNDVKVSPAGRQAACGKTRSSNFPTSNGVQAVFGNGTFASGIVVQFNLDNSRHWATYYGGLSTTTAFVHTQVEGLDIDPNGDVFITGVTSTTDLPLHTWGGAYYQNSINNGCTTCTTNTDAFVAKISANGQTLIWSTYWGGDGNEIAYDIHVAALDPNDFYIGGTSTSTNNPFPNTLPAWSAGTGFYVRFDYLGNDIYGSHIGNPGTGAVHSIAVGQNFNVLLCGEIGPGTAFPVLLPSSGNTGNATFTSGTGTPRDAFMTLLDDAATPNIVWSMYYGGSMSESANEVVANPYGATPKYWVIGNALKTPVNNGAPPMFDPGNGAYFDNTFNGGVTDAWVMQLDGNGNIPWATFYGGNGEEYGRGVAIDYNENLYITGETQSTDLNSNGAFPSPNLTGAYTKTSFVGPGDLYVACFAGGTYAPVWGTYYGGGYEEWTPAIACYGNSTLYLVGGHAGSSTYPLYSGPGCIGSGTPYTDFTFSSPTASYQKSSIAGFCLGPIFVDVSEPEDDFGVNIFPNPTDGMFTVSGQLATSENVVVEVYDVLGQLVYQQTINSTMTVNTQVDLSDRANGVYMVNVRAGENFTTEKIVLQR